MKFRLIVFIAVLLISATGVYAELHDRGGGLIYDDVLNVTWLQDANYAVNSGYTSGRLDWHSALAWADQLEYGGYADWRLPSAGTNPVNGYESNSEMGHLYYNELGNVSGSGGFTNNGPFQNLQPHRYWTGTEFDSGVPDPTPILNAWEFLWTTGWQQNSLPGYPGAYSMAVRDGDVVPHTYCVSTSAELQDALNVAATNSTPDIIRIRSSVTSYVGNFVYTSTEPYGLTIEGGYNSDCTARVVDYTNTVLDGDNTGRVLAIDCSGVAADFVADGLTIQNGEANGGNGGGLNLNTAGVVTLSNSIIKNNSKNITGFNGGGVYIEGAGLAIIEYSIFDNNGFQNEHIYDGGGIYVSDVNEIRLKNNLFKNNGANGGAGVYLNNATIATVENNTFDKNNGASSGAMRILYSDLVSFSGNLVVNNTSYSCAGLSIQHSTDVYLIQNIFNRNRATNGSGGGFVADSNENINIYNNFFTNNTASYFGGGFMSEKSIVADVTNNTFSDNTSEVGGGGVWIQYNIDSAVATLYNNIIYGNSSATGSDIYIDNDDDNNGSPGTTNLYNNNFDQSDSGIFMKIDFTIDTSNLNNIDPDFVDPENDDYHLTKDSPCIDAGVDAGVYDDIDGNSRPQGAGYDIGADEYVTEIITIDDIIDSFKQGVADGTIKGCGRPWIANARLWTFRQMLESAKRQLENGRIDRACRTLHRIERRCDGEPRPKDFIKGDAVLDLYEMILDLIELQCE